MPEAERLHQDTIIEGKNSEINDHELDLRVGNKTNEVEIINRLKEEYATLAKEKKLLEELLAMEREEAIAEDTKEAPSLPENKQEKANVIERVMERARNSRGFKTVLAGVVAITTIFSGFGFSKGDAGDTFNAEAGSVYAEAEKPPSNINQLPEELRTNPNLVMHGEEDTKAETELGIHNGYGEKGMWLSENKSGRYAFANAAEVAEVCNNDEEEMMNYAADNQVESFADYLANLPEELQPEGFKGLGIVDTEHKLEELSEQDFKEIKKQFYGAMDKAFTRRVVANGKYDNAYMALKDINGDAIHENMDIIKCTTNEHNLEVTEFYWEDDNGNEIGSMMVKMSPVYDDGGNIVSFKGCMQVIKPHEQGSPVYKKLTVVPANVVNTPIKTKTTEKVEITEVHEEQPEESKESKESIGSPAEESKESIGSPAEETPVPTSAPTETPQKPTGGGHHGGGTPTKQWGKEGDPHGGPDVTPSDLVDPNSEITKEENDKINNGNQGYVDDNKATPGSSSESNGVDESTGFAKSGITASGATTSEGRLRGGSNQAATASGESRMAGENAYQSSAATERGREVDNSGNNAQAAAQSAAINNSTSNLGGTNAGANAGSTTSAAGRDNNSNAAEERAVVNGDF